MSRQSEPLTGGRTPVLAILSEFNGKEYFHLRHCFLGADGEWHTTKKGVAISVDLFAGLVDALQKVIEGSVLEMSVRKSRDQIIVVSDAEWNGDHRIDVREHICRNDKHFPTENGVVIPFNRSLAVLAEVRSFYTVTGSAPKQTTVTPTPTIQAPASSEGRFANFEL